MNTRLLSRAPLAALALVATGCGLSREKGPSAAPEMPEPPQVTGTVVRDGVPAAGIVAVLSVHDSLGAAVDTVVTDETGSFGFPSVPPGYWIARVSSPDSSDLAYVRAFFQVVNEDDPVALPAFDLDPHGLVLVTPADGATVPQPTSTDPLRLEWSAYELPYISARARVTAGGITAWSSTQRTTTEAEWIGVGNRGVYVGMVLPAGNYRWRVRLQLPDSVQVGTRLRTVVLQ